MRILLVEDDHLQAEPITEALQRALPGVTVERVKTESEFYEWMDRSESGKPDAVIMDVIIRWTDPDPGMALPPPEVDEQGPSRAGFRCIDLLEQNKVTRSIPVLLYTVLGRDDLRKSLEELGRDVIYLSKSNAAGPLIKKIKQLLTCRPRREQERTRPG